MLPLLPALLVAALHWVGGDLLFSLRNTLFDQYQRWQPRTYVEAPVRILDIDDASLEKLGQWPWPRNRIAGLVDRLNAAGVAAIVFDVMFAEPDRTSPDAVVALWQLKGSLRESLAGLPDHDQVLASRMRLADVVLGFAVDRKTGAENGKMPLGKAAFVHLGEPQIESLHRFSGAVTALPALEATARGNGALTFVPDRDGVVRRVPLALRLGDMPVPTLVSEALRVAQGVPLITLRSAGHLTGLTGERDRAGLGEIRIGEVRVPTTAQGEMWLYYTRHRPERTVPAWRLMAGEIPPESLAGQMILIGSSAQGLMDLRFNPFGLMPGVEAHAQALEQMLSGQYLERPAWAAGAEWMVMIAASFLVGFLALRAGALLAALVTGGLLIMLGAGAWRAFVSDHLLLDAGLPVLGVLLSFMLCSLAHHLWSEREQRWIKAAFSRYVSPNRVSYLVEHPEAMALGGRRQDCSFIFTDLAGFTSLMEKIDPGAAVELLNDYLDEMIAIAFRHEGTLDRIVGDAVAIMFSAPVPQADHRQRAMACALEMDAFADQYAQARQAEGIPFGKTRIGVHCGEVIVGNFGGRNIFDYRALGDPINTAARLESVNKHLGTRMCVSAAILADCPAAPVRPVGRLVLKGKSEPLTVFEPVTEDAVARAPRDAYGAAFDALAVDGAQALDLFRELAANYPDDPLVLLHCRRLLAGETGDLIVMAEK